jgi:DNA-binding MarR family transcriptional regulator
MRTTIIILEITGGPFRGAHMAKESHISAIASERRAISKRKFDSNGVRKALIALLLAIHKQGRHHTVADVLVAYEIIDSHLEGRPHSMKSLAEKLEIPYTSVSRIIYSLTSEAAPGGVLRLVPDTHDRRRKHIEVDIDGLRANGAQLRALEKAMIDYYGSSVQALKKAIPD